MKKKKIFIFILLSFLIYAYFPKYFEFYAGTENDYLSYQEIIMSSGKLIKNFTDEEKEAIYSKFKFNGDLKVVIFDSQNVDASYISETTELIENNSDTNVDRKIAVTIETNKKVTFSASGSITSLSKSAFKGIKNDITAKAGVEYNKSTTKSIKEVNDFTVSVPPNTQYMVVVEGHLRITNGAIWTVLINKKGLFEIVTIDSQFYHYEVREL